MNLVERRLVEDVIRGAGCSGVQAEVGGVAGADLGRQSGDRAGVGLGKVGPDGSTQRAQDRGDLRQQPARVDLVADRPQDQLLALHAVVIRVVAGDVPQAGIRESHLTGQHLLAGLDVDVEDAAAVGERIRVLRLLLDFVRHVDLQAARSESIDELHEPRQVDHDGTVDLDVGELADRALERTESAKELAGGVVAGPVLGIPGRVDVGCFIPQIIDQEVGLQLAGSGAVAMA